jgi:hypothetical protein
MSSRPKQYAAAPAVPGRKPIAKGHAKAEARKRSRQRYGQSRGLPWLKIGVGTVAVLLIALLGLNFLNTGSGKLSAQSTSYAFGDVPWRGGYVYTKFPITVEGNTTVNDIAST